MKNLGRVLAIVGAFMGWIAVMGLPLPSGYLPVDYDNDRGITWVGFKESEHPNKYHFNQAAFQPKASSSNVLRATEESYQGKKKASLEDINPDARELKLVRWGDL